MSKPPPLHAQRTVQKNRRAAEHAIATSHKTQGQRALNARRQLQVLTSKLSDIQRALTAAVGEAQNPSPDGAADGTLVDPEWSRCRDISDALRKLLEIA